MKYEKMNPQIQAMIEEDHTEVARATASLRRALRDLLIYGCEKGDIMITVSDMCTEISDALEDG